MSIREMIGLGLIVAFVTYMMIKAVRGTRGPGGHDRWGRY